MSGELSQCQFSRNSALWSLAIYQHHICSGEDKLHRQRTVVWVMCLTKRKSMVPIVLDKCRLALEVSL